MTVPAVSGPRQVDEAFQTQVNRRISPSRMVTLYIRTHLLNTWTDEFFMPIAHSQYDPDTRAFSLMPVELKYPRSHGIGAVILDENEITCS